MKKAFFSFIILAQSLCLFGGKQEDLAMIQAVTTRANKDYLELIGHFKNGSTIIYKETISGENAGFAHCSTIRSEQDPVIDVTKVDYWATILRTRMEQFQGNK